MKTGHFNASNRKKNVYVARITGRIYRNGQFSPVEYDLKFEARNMNNAYVIAPTIAKQRHPILMGNVKISALTNVHSR